MISRLPGVIVSVLAVIVVFGPAPASRAEPSAAGLYLRAFRTLERSHRFDIVTVTSYVGQHGTIYRSDHRFIEPRRLLTSYNEGAVQGALWQVQVGSSYCHWNVALNVHRVVCQRLPWRDSTPSQDVRAQIPKFPLTRSHYSLLQETRSAIRIKVTGKSAFPCLPGRECAAATPGTLTGVITIDALRMLPRSFAALISEGTFFMRMFITYRYDRGFSIDLPHGTRIPCPNYAPPHSWCLSQRKN